MPLVDLLYPPRCPLCGAAIAKHGGLCGACWEDLAIPGEPACVTCSRPFLNDSTGACSQCAPCMLNPPRHAGITAGVLYNDAARKLVLAFKHGGKIGLAPLIAKLISSRLPASSYEQPLLVPVPLHRWRLWHRGYNQAALLARELEKSGKGELCVDLLVRTKSTPSLGGLGRKSRSQVLRGVMAIAPKRKHILKGRNVLLIDDVLTSGATSDACVGILLGNGAKSVKIACFARVLDDAPTGARPNMDLLSGQ